MATLWRMSGQQARDLNGVAYVGAKLYIYDAETNIPRTAYQDNDLSTPHASPIVADAQGRFPAVFLQAGLYRERVTTSGGVLIWDFDSIDASPTSVTIGGGGGTTEGLTTGDVIWRPASGTKSGFVRLNSRTIGSASSGASERANADTEDLFTFLWNNLADAQAAVSSGRGASASADFAANKTITLPDLRFKSLLGLSDMGNTAVSIDAKVPIGAGGSATAPGSSVGEQVNTLASTEIPSHSHTGTTDAGGSHTITTTPSSTAILAITGSGTGLTAGGGTQVNFGVTLNNIPTHTHAFTTGNTGGGGAHNNFSPGVVGTFYMKL